MPMNKLPLTREESFKERALQILNLRYLNETDLKASYKRRIFDHHPDRHPETKENTEQFKEYEKKIMVINQAYELLQDVLGKMPIDLAKYCLIEDTTLVKSLLPKEVNPAAIGKTEQELWIEKFKDRF